MLRVVLLESQKIAFLSFVVNFRNIYYVSTGFSIIQFTWFNYIMLLALVWENLHLSNPIQPILYNFFIS